MISQHYNDTGEIITVGDKVLIDEIHPGVVTAVFLPGSSEAAAYSCFETGGLLIELEISGSTLIPFGTNEEIRKIWRDCDAT